MDMEEDVDDPMEIEEMLPVTPIIERKSGESEPIVPVPTNENELNKSLAPNLSEKSENAKKADSENDVVVLDDDEEPPQTKKKENIDCDDIIDLVEHSKGCRCLNMNCTSKSKEFIFAPDFCLAYFRVKKSKSNNEEICMDCYVQAVTNYDKLVQCLGSDKSIFDVQFPIINETLQIDDSDEEPEENESEEYISEDNYKFIEDNIDDVFESILNKLDLSARQIKEQSFLEQQNQKIKADCEELEKSTKEIRKALDSVQIGLYNTLRPEYRPLKPIAITDDVTFIPPFKVRLEEVIESPRKSSRVHKPVSYVDIEEPDKTLSPKKEPVPEKVEIPKDIPIAMMLDRPDLKVGETYYIMRENVQQSWVRARLQSIMRTDPFGNSFNYKLIELKKQNERTVTGKCLAYLNYCKSRLTVGTRIIAALKDDSEGSIPKRFNTYPYYCGVIGEQPVEANKYRYLVFFDIGRSKYLNYCDINLIYESSENVWEDVALQQQNFIKKYLESQDRPMVKLLKDQHVRVEYNGKWFMCRVSQTDCSLVQVSFDSLNRTEWIYRGSTRLSPMFREEQAATNRLTARANRKALLNEPNAVVQYTRNKDFVQNKSPESGEVRAVARKSTAKPISNVPVPNIVPFLPPVNNMAINTTGPTSKIMYFTPRDQAVTHREYRPHECSKSCKNYLTHNFAKLRGHNPLSKPLLCGWARLTVKDRGRKDIIYKAPCGRMIRNISEVHYYLRKTESEMTVDLFDFNHMVRCLAEFSVECVPDPKDLSRGLEQVPIPVINGINNDMLDFCNYSIKRVPMEDVHMNLDTEFLSGCDCEDDCVDKMKCSCWKLTLDAAKYLGKENDPISIGYIYRRLQDQVITGIYECNSRCKCSSTCLNRVVQNPMSLKLQVFRTHNRGWGIRCLNDIPQGTFICIYAGTLHTESMANEDGKAYGDEYFAELDYIETVENFKEDYEAEAYEDEEEATYRKTPPPDDEEDEPKSVSQNKKKSSKTVNYNEDNDFTPSGSANLKNLDPGIRSRLRKRKEEEEKKERKETKKEEPKAEKKEEIKPVPKSKLDIMFDKIKDSKKEESISDIDTVTISDEEDEGREVLSFNPKNPNMEEKSQKYPSVRELFLKSEKDNIYIMDAKNAGNIGRFLNHSCSPNVFVQNVFVDTHDLRFPWVAFFSSQFIRAGTELTWNYNYDIGSVPGRVLYCHCASLECKGRLL